MDKEYKKIYFSLWSSIEDAVNELLDYKEKGVFACGEFNGTILYSDTVTLDGAYRAITGKTKIEVDKPLLECIETYEKQEKEHTYTS